MKTIKIALFLLVSLAAFHELAAKSNLPDIKYAAHPRLLLTDNQMQGMLQNIAGDSIWSQLQGSTLEACHQLLDTKPLQRVMEGKRLLATSRKAVYRIFMLTYAYRVTGDPKFADRGKQELLAVCRYLDWNPDHFLDVAEMTFAVSIGYDWLYKSLNASKRKEIANAIFEKGLKPSLDNRYNDFLARNNNWNQVGNSAMAFGAMAIIEERPELAKKIIERSIESIKNPMKRYGPDGAYPEGYGYWHYGTTYNVMLLALLDQVYGTDFGLSKIPGFTKSAYYMMHMVGPTYQSFNFSDSDSGLRLNTSMFWFAKKLKDPTLTAYEIHYLLGMKDFAYGQYNRMLPSIFIFGNTLKLQQASTRKLPLTFVAKNEAPVSLMRTSWNDQDAIYVGIKGGCPSDNNHSHLDEGSFVMDALGVRWAIDLGAQDYNSLEKYGLSIWDSSQGSKRWDVYRYNNKSHNVITVNDKLFNVNGQASIRSHSASPDLMETTIDLSSIYDGQLAWINRKVSVVRGEFVELTDDILTNDNEANISWRMLTRAKVTITGGGFFLKQDGKSLFVSVPENGKPFLDEAVAPNIYDAPNPGVTIIGYKITLPAKSTASLMVKLIPLSRDKIIGISNNVADRQIRDQANVRHHPLDWTNGAWYKGLAQWAKVTDNQKYFDFLKLQGEKNNWNVHSRPYHADDICVAQMYFDLYKKYGDRNILQPTKERLDYVVSHPSKAPLQKTDPHGRDERWSWCDALFMAPPVYAAMYTMTGDKGYVEFMEKEFKECTDSLFDRENKLYFRDCSKIDLREPNGEQQFWARGNGWVMAGIPIILDNLPPDYPNRKYYIDLFKDLAEGVLHAQDQRGAWHASLLDQDVYPQPENSASAFFCYAIAWGIRNGLLDPQRYQEPALRAWASLRSYVKKDGMLGYIQPVGHDPQPADENTTDVYGVGAFLLASSEILKLEENNQTK